MPSTIKGILVDPFTEAISEIELTKPILTSLYDAIGCRAVDAAGLENLPKQHDVFLDDEGLYVPEQRFFSILDYAPYLIVAGKGVIVHINDKGESESHSLDIDDLKEKIKFYTPISAYELAKELGI